ncbi:unnamed protein product [Dovyalis caffra]|uniref:Uncharacterized protein n=1 Tax=Dovyalis caffra TaxID=77055 RepID=A0AAV1RLY2_9ROSI|nr:unnamed protein product [Dovyalis caffra]
MVWLGATAASDRVRETIRSRRGGKGGFEVEDQGLGGLKDGGMVIMGNLKKMIGDARGGVDDCRIIASSGDIGLGLVRLKVSYRCACNGSECVSVYLGEEDGLKANGLVTIRMGLNRSEASLRGKVRLR